MAASADPNVSDAFLQVLRTDWVGPMGVAVGVQHEEPVVVQRRRLSSVRLATSAATRLRVDVRVIQRRRVAPLAALPLLGIVVDAEAQGVADAPFEHAARKVRRPVRTAQECMDPVYIQARRIGRDQVTAARRSAGHRCGRYSDFCQ
jgi:hypothetical protein